MHEPTPEQYNPPLTWWAHTWRTGLALAITGLVCVSTIPLQLTHDLALLWVDLGVGVLALVLSFFRRRWPLAVAVLTALAGAVSASAAGPGALAAVSLATRRRVWQVVVVGTVGLAASQVFWVFQPRADANPWWVSFAVAVAITVAMMMWGMYIGSRRELVWTLRDRAERAEAQQELLVEQGRSNERARIAREMHDVLAHRISLIAMHAGALAYRTDLTADEIRESAELIQSKSHEALTDLRHVLGVLREDEAADGAGRGRPQPTFDDLVALIEEAEQTGMRIAYDDRVLEAERMPDPVGRATYRIVQEGLTNARKHAPGVSVLVQVSGSPESGVDIRIRNPARGFQHLPGHADARPPGARLGLVGLRERAKLAGGRLESSLSESSFELRGWLPWSR